MRIGDVVVVNVPGEGVIGVGVVSETWKHLPNDPLHDDSKWHKGSGFAHRVGVTWTIAPKPQGGFFQTLAKLPNSFMHRDTITAQPTAKGHSLLAWLHQTASFRG